MIVLQLVAEQSELKVNEIEYANLSAKIETSIYVDKKHCQCLIPPETLVLTCPKLIFRHLTASNFVLEPYKQFQTHVAENVR